MTRAGLPDRETLLVWMSAFLDGELPPEDEAILLQAMEQDPELVELFEKISEAFHPAMSGALDAEEARELTENVLLAVAPAGLSLGQARPEEPHSQDHILMWASLDGDDALDEEGARQLRSACAQASIAKAVTDFVESSESVGHFLAEWPKQADVQESLRPLSAQVAAHVQATEARQMACSAALDGEEAAAGSWDSASDEEASTALLFLQQSEVIGEFLREPISDPAAQRAGAAALQVIAAQAAQAADAERISQAKAAAAAPASRPKVGWWRFIPVTGLAMAAVGWVVWSAASPSGPGRVTAMEPSLVAASEPPSAWEPLQDNTAEVRSLDSGSHVAAVFATDASKITVIWVAEPEDEPPTETGT